MASHRNNLPHTPAQQVHPQQVHPHQVHPQYYTPNLSPFTPSPIARHPLYYPANPLTITPPTIVPQHISRGYVPAHVQAQHIYHQMNYRPYPMHYTSYNPAPSMTSSTAPVPFRPAPSASRVTPSPSPNTAPLPSSIATKGANAQQKPSPQIVQCVTETISESNTVALATSPSSNTTPSPSSNTVTSQKPKHKKARSFTPKTDINLSPIGPTRLIMYFTKKHCLLFSSLLNVRGRIKDKANNNKRSYFRAKKNDFEYIIKHLIEKRVTVPRKMDAQVIKYLCSKKWGCQRSCDMYSSSTDDFCRGYNKAMSALAATGDLNEEFIVDPVVPPGFTKYKHSLEQKQLSAANTIDTANDPQSIPPMIPPIDTANIERKANEKDDIENEYEKLKKELAELREKNEKLLKSIERKELAELREKNEKLRKSNEKLKKQNDKKKTRINTLTQQQLREKKKVTNDSREAGIKDRKIKDLTRQIKKLKKPKTTSRHLEILQGFVNAHDDPNKAEKALLHAICKKFPRGSGYAEGLRDKELKAQLTREIRNEMDTTQYQLIGAMLADKMTKTTYQQLKNGLENTRVEMKYGETDLDWGFTFKPGSWSNGLQKKLFISLDDCRAAKQKYFNRNVGISFASNAGLPAFDKLKEYGVALYPTDLIRHFMSLWCKSTCIQGKFRYNVRDLKCSLADGSIQKYDGRDGHNYIDYVPVLLFGVDEGPGTKVKFGSGVTVLSVSVLGWREHFRESLQSRIALGYFTNKDADLDLLHALTEYKSKLIHEHFVTKDPWNIYLQESLYLKVQTKRYIELMSADGKALNAMAYHNTNSSNTPFVAHQKLVPAELSELMEMMDFDEKNEEHVAYVSKIIYKGHRLCDGTKADCRRILDVDYQYIYAHELDAELDKPGAAQRTYRTSAIRKMIIPYIEAAKYYFKSIQCIEFDDAEETKKAIQDYLKPLGVAFFDIPPKWIEYPVYGSVHGRLRVACDALTREVNSTRKIYEKHAPELKIYREASELAITIKKFMKIDETTKDFSKTITISYLAKQTHAILDKTDRYCAAKLRKAQSNMERVRIIGFYIKMSFFAETLNKVHEYCDAGISWDNEEMHQFVVENRKKFMIIVKLLNHFTVSDFRYLVLLPECLVSFKRHMLLNDVAIHYPFCADSSVELMNYEQKKLKKNGRDGQMVSMGKRLTFRKCVQLMYPVVSLHVTKAKAQQNHTFYTSIAFSDQLFDRCAFSKRLIAVSRSLDVEKVTDLVTGAVCELSNKTKEEAAKKLRELYDFYDEEEDGDPLCCGDDIPLSDEDEDEDDEDDDDDDDDEEREKEREKQRKKKEKERQKKEKERQKKAKKKQKTKKGASNSNNNSKQKKKTKKRKRGAHYVEYQGSDSLPVPARKRRRKKK